MTIIKVEQNKVYLFGTCLIDVFYPAAGMDALALLELCGYQVIYPQQQTCCGQPAYNSGYTNEAKTVAKSVLDLFSAQAYPVIVPSASCAAMIKHHYPKLFAADPVALQQAEELAHRTYELLDFLADKLPYEAALGSPQQPALHLSCSAQREMKVSERWLSLLKRLPGCDPILPADHEECCGFGGTFAIKSADISSAMTADKCKALQACQSKTLVSGDCGCLMNIEAYARKHNMAMQCEHIASFLAKQFGIHHEN